MIGATSLPNGGDAELIGHVAPTASKWTVDEWQVVKRNLGMERKRIFLLAKSGVPVHSSKHNYYGITVLRLAAWWFVRAV